MADWRKIIRENIDMKNLNTMKINAIVKFYSKPLNLDELLEVINFAQSKNLKILILGNGSNIIFSKKYYNDLVIIDMKNFNKIEINNDILKVEAGVKSKDLINFSLKNRISGFEFIAGIPGTIGGMIKMNAGAFGKNISNNLIKIKALDLKELKLVELKKSELKFSYRKTYGLENKIIISAKFKVNFAKKTEINDLIKEYLKIRKSKQPAGFSAGSIFKNPHNNFAGKLIEDCGLKGFSINDASISEKHANFIINRGNAKGEDIVKLIEVVKNRVKEKFNIKLEEEVEIV